MNKKTRITLKTASAFWLVGTISTSIWLIAGTPPLLTLLKIAGGVLAIAGYALVTLTSVVILLGGIE